MHSRAFVSFGRLAMLATNLPTSSASTNPSSFARLAASSSDMMALFTFPGLTKQTATTPPSALLLVVSLKNLPSTERHLFNPLKATFDVVYGIECRRGAWSATLPMLIILPPSGVAIFFMAYLLKINGTTTFNSMTMRKSAAETSQMGSFPREHPAQLTSRSNLFKDGSEPFLTDSKCSSNTAVTASSSERESTFRNLSQWSDGGRRPMTIMCHLTASVDDAFRASAIANPIVPLAPVRRHTFVVVMVSVVNCCGCVIGSKLQLQAGKRQAQYKL
mmetsp:Transcript_9659/g.14587  ORF Transcript_9659/g.14587 Transcript_9659/m.14587 type:complete len:275 (+) Transcript_9659:1224-2048(+)